MLDDPAAPPYARAPMNAPRLAVSILLALATAATADDATRIGAQKVITFHVLESLARGKATSPFLPAREPLYDKVDAEKKNPLTVQHPWGGEGANRFMRLRVKKTDPKAVMTELRDCLAVPLVGRIDFPDVTVLPGSELRLGTHYLSKGHGRARLRVLAVEGSKETPLVDEAASGATLYGGGWVEKSISLASLAGKRVTLRFEVDDERLGANRWSATRGDAKGVGLFAHPRIVSWVKAADASARKAAKDLTGHELGRNVIVTVFDSGRADLMSPVREERGLIPSLTPNLDRFAKKAMRFSRAFSAGNQTRTGAYSLVTSLPPSVAGWWQTRWEFDDATRARFYGGKLALLTQEMRKAGYTVGHLGFNGFLNGSMYLSLDMGFDFVREYNGVPENTVRMTDGIIDWLGEHKDEKFFIVVWYEPPHFPYSPPKGYVERAHAMGVPKDHKFFHRGFLGKMVYGDEHFGRLLTHLEKSGTLDKSVMVITADHGEAMDLRHDGYSDNVNTQVARMHGKSFFDEEVHIPMLVRAPGAIPEDRTVKNQVSLIDLGPTLLELVGLKARPEVQFGRSFAGLARGGSEPDTRWAYFEGRWSAGFRESGWKYIFHERDERLRFNNPEGFQRKRDGEDELYDTSKDPFELTNLASKDPAARKRLRARYGELRKIMADFHRKIGHDGPLPRPLSPLAP